MAQVVEISRVVPLGERPSFFIRKMRAVLERQGQIEPLQVYAFEDHFLVWHDDSHGSDIVFAARELGWSTLLIVDTKRYEP